MKYLRLSNFKQDKDNGAMNIFENFFFLKIPMMKVTDLETNQIKKRLS